MGDIRGLLARVERTVGRRWATFLALTIGMIWIIHASSLSYDRLNNVFQDDAFYYFGIARHIATGMGSTFGGIDQTNGYHPLWLLLLVPIFALSSATTSLLLVLLLSAALVVATAASLDRIRMIEPGGGMTILGGAILLLMVAGQSNGISMTGMESAPLIMFLVLLGELWVRTGGLDATRSTWRDYWVLAALATLCMLSRLDSAVLMAIIYSTLAVGRIAKDRHTLVPLVVTAMMPTVIMLSYLLINKQLFGSWVPVSGVAKSLGGGDGWLLVEYLAGPKILGYTSWGNTVSILFALLVLILRNRLNGPARFAGGYGVLVAVGGAVLGAYYAATSSYGFWSWYYYATPVALAFNATFLVQLGGRRWYTSKAVAVTLTLVLLASTLVSSVWSRNALGSHPWILTAPRVAEKIDALPVSGSIAVGDRAGALGFNLRRPLVQLEGLVEAPGYLNALQGGAVGSFLESRNVSMYANQTPSAGVVLPDTPPGCVMFREPAKGLGPKMFVTVCDRDLLVTEPVGDGTYYRVWRYRAELNP